MSLITATAYNQSSRRTANSEQTARKTEVRSRDASANRSAQTRKIRKENTLRANNTQSASRKNTINTKPARTRTNNTENNIVRTANTHVVNTKPYRNNTSTNTRNTGSAERVYKSTRRYTGKHAISHHYYTTPRSRAYRAKHYGYRAPVAVNIIWTPLMHRHYIRMYPVVKYWHYQHGYHIANTSAYYADYYIGAVRTVYGRVREVYYSRSSDEYFLYFGAYYPYHDFTVVMPGWMARRYSIRPDRYFSNQYLAITGLITSFNGDPEIVVKESFQIKLY